MTRTTLSLLLAAALAVPGFALAAPSVSADRGASRAAQGPIASEARTERARHGRRGHDPERRVARMTAELELDDTQVRAVRDVMQAARAEREALRELPRSAELREQRRAIMERAKAQIDALLTPEQRAALEARRAEREQHGIEQGERGARGIERGERGTERGIGRQVERVEPEARTRARGLERGERGARGAERGRAGVDPRGV